MEKHMAKVLELRKNLSSKDIHRLLKPVNKTSPSGESLLYTDTYDQIRNARINEDKNIPRGVWIRPLKEADWNAVEELCTDALIKKSKDLQIAAWLLEAWFHKYQVWGLLHGLRLERELITLFWDSAYPESKKDPEYRLAPFEWLNQKFVKRLTETVLVLPESNDAKRFTYGDYLSLSFKNNSMKIKESRERSNDTQLNDSLDEFKKSQKLTSPKFYKLLVADLDACLNEISNIETYISSKVKGVSGCLNHLRTQLQNLKHTTSLMHQEVEPIPAKDEPKVKDIPKEPPAQSQPDQAKTKNKKEPTMAAKGSTAIQINSRQQAYDQLKVIADQLAIIEPHSPTPYMIRKAVAWGEMTLAEVMKELSQEGGDILKMMKLLGIDQNSKQQ